MPETEKSSSKKAEAAFPLFPSTDFDISLTERIVPVGFQSTYPVEWRRRVVAAMISGQLRYSGVDYALKQYVRDVDYPEGRRNRPDLVISRRLESFLEEEANLLIPLYATGDDPIGTFLCEMTLTRVVASFRAALTLANRGLLFEAVAVCRMAIEQIGWSFDCHGIADHDQVRALSARRSVTNLKLAYPTAGRLYGWLSRHSHWQFPEHVKIMRRQENDVVAVIASTRFKAEALAVIVVCADCFGATLEKLYLGKLAKHLVLKARPRTPQFRADRETVKLMRLLLKHAPKNADVQEIATLLA